MYAGIYNTKFYSIGFTEELLDWTQEYKKAVQNNSRGSKNAFLSFVWGTELEVKDWEETVYWGFPALLLETVLLQFHF